MSNKKKLELKIYEFLGVKQFKKAVFMLEKIIHKRDKGKNINYHIKNSNDRESVDSFKKYLYYNGFIHTKNLITGIPIIVFAILCGQNLLFLIPLILFLIKDVYCVMLQRYNWLKISEFEKKLEIRDEKKIDLSQKNFAKKEIKIKMIEKDVSSDIMIEKLQLLRSYLLEKSNDMCTIDNNFVDMVNESKTKKRILENKEK
jgi:hypothetical protein